MLSPRESFYSCFRYLHCIVALLFVFIVIASVGNFQIFISKQSLNYWDAETSVLGAFLWDLILLLIFIAQHSLMASGTCKQFLSTWFHITRSYRLVYVTATSLALMFMIVQWLSIPEAYLWFIDTQRHFLLWIFFFILHALAWVMIGLELILMDMQEMIGLRQIIHYYWPLQRPLNEKVRLLGEIYSRMRHPGVVLITLMLWVHPIMTLDRLLLACTLTSYLIGRHNFEETHYRFAESFFTKRTIEMKSSPVITYELYEKE